MPEEPLHADDDGTVTAAEGWQAWAEVDVTVSTTQALAGCKDLCLRKQERAAPLQKKPADGTGTKECSVVES